MIIFRYLSRELMATMMAISFIVLLISLSSRFVRYLSYAAAGKMDASVLFAVTGYRIPGFLELILPLGFFLGVLFAYGKLYMDSEMTVLSACGFSQKRILAYTLVPAFLVAGVEAGLSLVVTPEGLKRSFYIMDRQYERSEFDSLQAAQFQNMQDRAIVYVDSKRDDNTYLDGVFMAKTGRGDRGSKLLVVQSEAATQVENEQYGQRYLELLNGRRYVGIPGSAQYQVTEFSSFFQYLSESDQKKRNRVYVTAMPTSDLWGSDELKKQAALQWRLSMPILVLVVAILAVPLSKTNPRQGRYLKMLPAILLYFIYLASLTFAKGAVEDGRLPVAVGIWWVHLIFLSIGVLLYEDFRRFLWQLLRRQKSLAMPSDQVVKDA